MTRPISEGKARKGGVNEDPAAGLTRPAPPQAYGPSSRRETARALEIVMSRLKFDKQTTDALMYHLSLLRRSCARKEQEQ